MKDFKTYTLILGGTRGLGHESSQSAFGGAVGLVEDAFARAIGKSSSRVKVSLYQ